MTAIYQRPSQFINSDHDSISTLSDSLTAGASNNREKAVALYYWVRDQIRYNPYSVALKTSEYLASTTLARGEAWCVPKAILLAALCRAADIPARVGFADVRNHLSTQRMREMMETDLFYFHGYTSIWIDGQWVKATPAFNVELCERFGLRPLEFDGGKDSLYHEFDCAGNRHMEYVKDRGEHLDLPYDEMMRVFQHHYPRMMQALADSHIPSQQWDSDVASETAGEENQPARSMPD